MSDQHVRRALEEVPAHSVPPPDSAEPSGTPKSRIVGLLVALALVLLALGVFWLRRDPTRVDSDVATHAAEIERGLSGAQPTPASPDPAPVAPPPQRPGRPRSTR